MPELSKDVIAFIMLPAGRNGACADLQTLLGGAKEAVEKSRYAKDHPLVTNELVEPHLDPVVNRINHHHIGSEPNSRVKIIFVPSYLFFFQAEVGIRYRSRHSC